MHLRSGGEEEENTRKMEDKAATIALWKDSVGSFDFTLVPPAGLSTRALPFALEILQASFESSIFTVHHIH